jgi:hypothetical protein
MNADPSRPQTNLLSPGILPAPAMTTGIRLGGRAPGGPGGGRGGGADKGNNGLG